MIIKFSPQKTEIKTISSVKNNILKYNSDEINLNEIPNGATAANEFLTIDKDLEGNVTISMLWHYIESTPQNCFPKDLEITNGEIYPKESSNEA
jgi:hypothetical protein